MSDAVVILHQFSGEMVCGSDKGRIGHISLSLFEDLNLRNTLKIVKVPPGTEFQLEAQSPGEQSQANGHESIQHSTHSAMEHKIPLDQRIANGPILIAAGYSHYSGTWYGWLSGKDDYGGA